MRFPIPRMYMGTMTFGWTQTSASVDETIALEMMERFIKADVNIRKTSDHFLDSARIYAGGETETILGSTLETLTEKSIKLDPKLNLNIGTKAHPSQPLGLSADGIKDQLQTSLAAMNLDSVGEFYLHQPDTEHSLLESLQTLHTLVMDGTISSIGMSNFHASEMERAFNLCETHSLTKPSVYQGLYNPLNRLVEQNLIPTLRKHNCSFVAYNPLAAGLLTGKHQRSDLLNSNVKKGRFQNNPNYLPRFFTSPNFDALELIQKACDEKGITVVEATFRWLLCHSALDEKNDGILLGCSSLAQLDENLGACAAAASLGPLPDSVLKAFDDAWKITEEDAFPYWRSYSADMPDRENMDHGASYSANKVKK